MKEVLFEIITKESLKEIKREVEKEFKIHVSLSKTCIKFKIKNINFVIYHSKNGTDDMRLLYIDSKQITGGNIFNTIGYYINKIPTIIKNIPLLFKGQRKNYPPQFRAEKLKMGDFRITRMTVCKDVINRFAYNAMNILTGSQFQEEMSKLNYDDAYHLYIILKLDTNEYYRLEKNQVMALVPAKGDEGTKRIEVNIDNNIRYTLNEMLAKTERLMGDDLFIYNGASTNCQDFIYRFLKANGLDTPELKKFIVQDMQTVISKLPPLIQSFQRGVTDVAGLFDVLLEGEGLRKKKKKNKIK
jgi:hypothetical protein